MPPFILYLIKVNGVLLLFAVAYYLVLRNLTFYTINRFFLLGGLLFSSIYPFIDLTALFYSQKTIDPYWIQYVPATSLEEMAAPGFLWKIVAWVFYAGMLVMMIRFLLQLLSLRKIHSRSLQSAGLGSNVRVLNEKIHPFTFWQTIYLNPELHKEADLKVIMEHEKVHVKQWHTLDILLSQLSGIFYWFNPGIWFMKNFIKENLEFLTDQAVLKKGVEKKAYQYNMLKVETGISSLALINGFHLSGIKRRIRMMNTRQSSKSRLTVYFVVLPVIILFCLACTIAKIKQEPEKVVTNLTTDGMEMKAARPVIHEQKKDLQPAIQSPSPIKKQTRNKTLVQIPNVQKESGIEVQLDSDGSSPHESQIVNNEDSEAGILGNSEAVSSNKIITVMGYSNRIGINKQNLNTEALNPENRKKEVAIKMVQGIKIPKQNGSETPKITYYVNGVKTSDEKVNAIHSENIQEISVFKKEDRTGEIHLKLKKDVEQ